MTHHRTLQLSLLFPLLPHQFYRILSKSRAARFGWVIQAGKPIDNQHFSLFEYHCF
jgi:hypothetical protein